MTDPADPVAGKLNSLPKYVASSSITRPEWAGTTVISGDLAKEVTAIKENTEGELQVHGSAALAQSLLALDLVDTVHLLSFPVVLGTGRRLFAEGAVPTAFRHAGARLTSKGVAIHTYDLAGRPEYGTGQAASLAAAASPCGVVLLTRARFTARRRRPLMLLAALAAPSHVSPWAMKSVRAPTSCPTRVQRARSVPGALPCGVPGSGAARGRRRGLR